MCACVCVNVFMRLCEYVYLCMSVCLHFDIAKSKRTRLSR